MKSIKSIAVVFFLAAVGLIVLKLVLFVGISV